MSTIKVRYELCRIENGAVVPTGWTREGKAARNRYGRWCVSHNGKWRKLRHMKGSWYVIV